jgi:hypothetical protein
MIGGMDKNRCRPDENPRQPRSIFFVGLVTFASCIAAIVVAIILMVTYALIEIWITGRT